jgi:type II restriction enzyme
VIKDLVRDGLQKAIIEDFTAHWAIGGVLVYACVRGGNPGAIDADLLADLGIAADAYNRLPDVVWHDPLKNRLFLVDSITRHGPVSEQRRAELASLFSGARVHLIFVTAAPSRSMMAQHVLDVAWETEVWAADEPAHLIHFDGERFCGHYDARPAVSDRPVGSRATQPGCMLAQVTDENLCRGVDTGLVLGREV